MRARQQYAEAARPLAGSGPASLTQDELVLRHADLVKRIAYHLVSRMPPNVEVDDLIQAGMIGLLDAARHYTASKGANFETYAGIRIRGAMLDEVRKSDWTPRSVHRTVREMSEVVRRIENETGREARASDVAEALGISVEEYHRAIADAASCRLFSFDQMGSSDDDGPVSHARDENPGPQDDIEEEDFRKALAAAIEGLPEREKLVLSLYYDDELNLREIGAVLDVSESRVCQIHGQALVRLRARMEDWRQGR
ncbi:MAG: RNA polymerase sigma factor FliA [Proteobacteria bacterium]|nr:RNA polymerase sigma factor FliA [Pseudomonadota bacterium]